MHRFALLLPVACVFACGDATRFPLFPLPPSVVLASVAAHTDGPATGISCFPDTNETMDGPHMAVAVTLKEPPDTATKTACGNLVFDDRLRTIRVDYNIGGREPPYVYWWSGARRGATWLYVLDTLEVDTLAPEVNATFTDSLWLDDDYDGIGVVGVNSNDPTLAVAESVFTVAFSGGGDQFARNYMLQHWAEKLPPASIGAQVSGFVVTLSWTNRHGDRPIDSTVVFRDGVLRTTRDYLAESFVDTVPGVRHLRLPAQTRCRTRDQRGQPQPGFTQQPIVGFDPGHRQSAAAGGLQRRLPTVAVHLHRRQQRCGRHDRELGLDVR